MGLSGLAFRVRWCNEDTKTKWCGSSAIGEMPDEQALLPKLSGWSLPTQWLGTKGRDNEALRTRIVASIDAAKPVVAYPPTWNMAVIYGYEDDGKTVLVNAYDQAELPFRLPVEKLGPLFTFLGDYTAPPSLQDALKGALQVAVRNWRRERHSGGIGGREYWYGEAALNAWIKDLRELDSLPEKAQEGLKGLDPWNYVSLHDARKTATPFLKQWGGILDGHARQAVEKAASLYRQETQLLKPLLEAKRAEKKDWSKEMREREIEILTKARSLEAQAIEEIGKVLALLGEPKGKQ